MMMMMMMMMMTMKRRDGDVMLSLADIGCCSCRASARATKKPSKEHKNCKQNILSICPKFVANSC